MASLVKGQKVPLNAESSPAMNVSFSGAGKFDVLALLLDGSGKVAGTQYAVYKNNRTAAGSSVQLQEDKEFQIELAALPADVEKILLAAVKREGGLEAFSLHLSDSSGTVLHSFDCLPEQGAQTVVTGELYLHKGAWKFAAIGNAVGGGMEELLQLHGLGNSPLDFSEAKAPKIDTAKPVSKQAAPAPTGGINLAKVELKKQGDSINLSKTDSGKGELGINLNWSQGAKPAKGLFGSLLAAGSQKVDLDLGCFYELKDGSKGVVQALGNSFGNYNEFPFISLDQDDRTGASTGGENLRINGRRMDEFKRILVFALIYEGAANWSQVDGVVTLSQPEGPDIIVKLDEHRNGKRMCAVAMIENSSGGTSIKKIAQYFSGHRDTDKAFGWGMRWTAGSK